MFIYATLFIRSTTARLPNKALLFKTSFNIMLPAAVLFGRSTTVRSSHQSLLEVRIMSAKILVRQLSKVDFFCEALHGSLGKQV